MKVIDGVGNQLVEGTAKIYFSDVPYEITESDSLNTKSLVVNLLKWDTTGIETNIETDRFMSTTQEIPISYEANTSGILNITMAIDEDFDNFYTLWKWGMLHKKSEGRKPSGRPYDGSTPYGKRIMRETYCQYVEIEILDNNLNENVYIGLEKVRFKSVKGFSFGEYTNKSVITTASFSFNDMYIERISKIVKR